MSELSQTRAVNIRVEKHDVYCGRPSMWGNPFRIGPDGDRQAVLDKYRAYLDAHPYIVEAARRELSGKRLGCFCKPLACHLDILIARMEHGS